MNMLWPILRKLIAKPSRTVIVDDQRTWTAGKLLGASLFLADHIRSHTTARHVGIMLPSSGAFAGVMLGAWMAGRVIVPLNFLLKPEELAYVINNSEIDTIYTVGPMLDMVGGEAAIDPGINLVKLETLDFTGMPALRWPAIADADDLAVILYTSGTSGKPKGVMLTHGNLVNNVIDALEHAQITSADTFLGILPQFHSFGLTALTLLPLYAGAKVIYAARFIPAKVVALIRKHQPQVFMAVPSMYAALLSVKAATQEDLASLRLPISGGEPLPQAVHDAYLQRFNIKILEGYGLTETAPVTHWCTPTQNKPHAVGKALPRVQVRVVNGDLQPLPPNHDGEILLAGPNIMAGYFKRPDDTAAVFVSLPGDDGQPTRFFRTGDIGHEDEDGFLFITGRQKEMLIIGGENVFPREIEEVLDAHPSLNASAVIGRHDDMRGEVPIAFVELLEGETFDESALRQWCRDRLAGYKVPREIHPLDELPRNPTGKILRRELKA